MIINENGIRSVITRKVVLVLKAPRGIFRRLLRKKEKIPRSFQVREGILKG